MKTMASGFKAGFMMLLFGAFMAGCGGGGGGDSTPTPTPTPTVTTITGVAAAGAAVSGIVNVKGANGATASATINSDGSFSLDVSALTAPYILYAEGMANGQSVKIYSSGVAAGTINITPITDFILRNATDGSADSAYDSWSASSITATALQAAETSVQSQLQPLLDAAGISQDVDLISTTFTADHTGLDLVLDSLSISYDTGGTTATVTNNLTGSSFTDNVTSTSDDSAATLPTNDTTGSQTALTDAGAIKAVWDSIEPLYATTTPSSSAVTTWVNANVASDFLWQGQTRDQMLAEWNGDEGPGIGANFTFYEFEQMTPAPSPYQKGYKIKGEHTDSIRINSEPFETYMVYNGTNWLWYGDRSWIGHWVFPRAEKIVFASGSTTYDTKLVLDLQDGWSYAYNMGVRSAVFNGPGVSNVVMNNTWPDQDYTVYPFTNQEGITLSDAEISLIPDNAEYTIKLCSEEAATLSSNPSSCTALQTYTVIMPKRPYLSTELTDSLFPTLTSPISHSLSSLNWGGAVTISWTNSSYVNMMEASLRVSSDNTDYDVDVRASGTTATFDTTGLPTPQIGSVNLDGDDIYGRTIYLQWQLN